MEKVFRRSPPLVSVSKRKAKSLILSESSPTRVSQILRESSSSLLRHPAAHLAVAKLARAGRHDLVDDLIQSHSPSERDLVRVISLYSSARMLDRAFDAFRRVPTPSEKALSAILAAFLANRAPQRALDFFAKVPGEIGVAPTVASWNLVLKAMCEVGKSEEAMNLVIVRLEEEHGVVPDLCSYNVLVNALLKGGNEGGFWKIVEAMQKRGLQPNVVSYNCMIAMLCRKSDAMDAEKMFDEMQSKGVKPNLSTYKALISAFCKKGDLTSAKKWFDELRHDGEVAADGASYVMVMRLMIEKGESGEDLVELCKECLKKRWAPPFDVVRVVIEGLVKDNKVEEANRVAEMMKKCVKGPALMAWMKFESALPL